MRSVSVRLCDLEKVTLPLGFVGENIFTKVYIDCKKIFDEHPDAIPTLSVIPPQGDAYPAIVTKEGDMVIWEITASDLIYKGSGEMQLTFIQGEMIGKTWSAKTKIYKSIEPSGEVPDPIANWLTQANATLALVDEAIELIPETIDEKLQGFIDDTAGTGDTDKVWSADKSITELNKKAENSNARISGGLAVGTGNSAVQGSNAIANGRYSTAFGNYSIASGSSVNARGFASQAFGSGTETNDNASSSTAFGTGTIANGAQQVVFGRFNAVDLGEPESDGRRNYVEIVGNGDSAYSRKIARSLDWNGNERLKGDLYVGCNVDGTGGTKVAKITDIPEVATTAETQAIITEYGVSV